MIGTIVAAAIWALVASLLLSLVLGGLVAGAIAVTRPAAAARQALWSLALAAAGIAPVVILAVMLARGNAAPAVAPAPVAHPAAAAQHSGQRANVAISPAVSAHSAAPAEPSLRLPSPPDVTPVVAASIVGLWFLGALAGVIGLGRSLVRVRGLKLRSSPLDGTLATELPWLTTTSGREIYLRLSYETETPIAVGFRRPVILLPTDMATAEGLTSIEPLIMHEYAHLARYDDWSNLAQRATERIFWFNPLVWILGRRIALEREVAADEAVVARTRDPKNYATTLWRMAQEMRMPEHVVVAPGAMLTRKQISVRIERLLDEHPVGSRYAGATAFVIALIAATGVAGLAASAPPILLGQAEAAAKTTPPPVGQNLPAPAPQLPRAPLAAASPPVKATPDRDDAENIADTVRNSIDVAKIKSDAEAAVKAAAETHRIVHWSGDDNDVDNVPAHQAASGPLSRDLVQRCVACDFSHRNLHGIDLSNLSLTGDDFSRSDLSGANLSHSTLQGVDFSRSNLRNANLSQSKFTGVDFSHATLDGADLSNATLLGADLGHATMAGTKTTGIHLVGSALP